MAGRRGGDRKSKDKILPLDKPQGKSLEIAAKAVGLNRETYRQAKAVVDSGCGAEKALFVGQNCSGELSPAGAGPPPPGAAGFFALVPGRRWGGVRDHVLPRSAPESAPECPGNAPVFFRSGAGFSLTATSISSSLPRLPRKFFNIREGFFCMVLMVLIGGVSPYLDA